MQIGSVPTDYSSSVRSAQNAPPPTPPPQGSQPAGTHRAHGGHDHDHDKNTGAAATNDTGTTGQQINVTA